MQTDLHCAIPHLIWNRDLRNRDSRFPFYTRISAQTPCTKIAERSEKLAIYNCIRRLRAVP